MDGNATRMKDRGEEQPSGDEPRKSQRRSRGIDRLIDVMNYLQECGEPRRPNQIAAALGAPRSTIYEVVCRLTDARLLERFDDEGRVFLGRRLYHMGQASLEIFDLTREADLLLRELTHKTGETSQLCVLEGNKYTIALMRHGKGHIRISCDLGQKLPVPWTASGRLLVAHLSDRQVLKLVPDEDFSRPNGKRLAPEEFLRQVAQARIQGFWRLDGVLDSFSHCIAAPVIDSSGQCIATLSFVVPRSAPAKRSGKLTKVICEAASRLTHAIGGRTVAAR